MMTNLRGELTADNKHMIEDLELFEAVAHSLHLSSSEERDELKDVLFPSLLCSAVKVRIILILLIIVIIDHFYKSLYYLYFLFSD